MSLRDKFMLEQMKHITGHLDVDRRTGRSTMNALQCLVECYKRPNQWVEIRDHYATLEAHKYLSHSLQDLVKRLGFEGFEFRHQARSVPEVRLVLYFPESNHEDRKE